MIARKLESKIRDHLASGGANANLRLAGQAYAPAGSGLFADASGIGALERSGMSALGSQCITTPFFNVER